MPRETYYRQCTLARPTEQGTCRTTTWIPERAHGVDTKPGLSVRLKKHGAEDYLPHWWVVESVGTDRQPEKAVKDRAHNWQRSRKVSEA